MKDKIVGLVLGTVSGDALGMPVEGYTFERIQAEHGVISNYVSPEGHKWFKDEEAGTWTDDGQLTLATIQSLLHFPLHTAIRDDSGEQVMDSIAASHVEALKETTMGWGGSTRKAVRKLANGCPWKESGTSGTGKGKGNGVAMKIAPLAASLKKMQDQGYEQEEIERFYEFVLQFTMMTHQSEMAAISAFMQVTAVNYCLNTHPGDFHPGTFLDAVITSGRLAKQICRVKYPDLPLEEDDLVERVAGLFAYCDGPICDVKDIAGNFEGAGCYVYQSLPMAYAMFLQHARQAESPSAIICLTVSAGGDTDTTGAIVGALVGALWGASSFPSHLVEGLQRKEFALGLAHDFAAQLGY